MSAQSAARFSGPCKRPRALVTPNAGIGVCPKTRYHRAPGPQMLQRLTNPAGQRARSKAASHCVSVPNRSMSSLNGIPG